MWASQDIIKIGFLIFTFFTAFPRPMGAFPRPNAHIFTRQIFHDFRGLCVKPCQLPLTHEFRENQGETIFTCEIRENYEYHFHAWKLWKPWKKTFSHMKSVNAMKAFFTREIRERGECNFHAWNSWKLWKLFYVWKVWTPWFVSVWWTRFSFVKFVKTVFRCKNCVSHEHPTTSTKLHMLVGENHLLVV